jgi:phosphoenolpyruvate-protein phosphotransferase (PTS system enzyme I)
MSNNASSSRIMAAAVVLSGLAAAPGVAVGPAVVLAPRKVSYVRRLVRSSEVESEVERFLAGVKAAQEEMRHMADKNRSTFARAEVSILEAYVLMLGDELLADAVERNIRINRQCAEWAVTNAISDFAASLAMHTDAYLRERSHDFEFVGERLLLALTGSTSSRTLPKLTEPAILIAHDLSPADLLALGPEKLLAIATEVGTKTSHTAIVARALEIPSVLGIATLLDNVVSGDRVVIDGLRGTVTIRPTEDMVSKGVTRGQRHQALTRHLLGDIRRQTDLKTGELVHLQANIEFSYEAQYAIDHGAEGVGLYRTEFLYVDRRELPSEEEQLEHYRAVVRAMDGRPVTFRTFDIGGDKQLGGLSLPREPNPALGLRGVRLGLEHPEILLLQLRAMIRASSEGDVRIMVPMIACLREWVEVRRLFSRALDEVDERGHPRAKNIPLGLMIEVPSAAIMADLFARHGSFLSLGTNDLVQYMLAVDRTSPQLAHLASPFDPSVLRVIKSVAEAADAAERPITVCGAMAGDPLAAILLVGLGFHALSMEPAAIPEIKEALHRVTFGEAAALAEEALLQPSSEDVEHLLAVALAPRLFDLLSGEENGDEEEP